MKRRILVVEDDALVADMVTLNLEHAGYEVETAGSAEDGLRRLTASPCDLIVLDLMLPGMEGVELITRLRDGGDATPVLMLTARGDTATKVRSFERGADDFLTKPFAMPELLARVNALIRRHTSSRGVPTSRVLRVSRFEVNLDTREALTNEGRVSLSEKEAALFEYFAAHEGELLSRTEILENVWGMDSFPTSRTVDNYVLRLRKLFEPDPENPVHFTTVRGRGYLYSRSGTP